MGRFVIRKVDSGVKFDLQAANGQGILTSEVYESAAACRKGIESVRKNALRAKVEDLTAEEQKTVTNPKFQVYRDKAGQYRFRLRSRNGEIIGVSGDYTSRAACRDGMDSVRLNAGEAEIWEEDG